jgi:hypothetical protein
MGKTEFEKIMKKYPEASIEIYSIKPGNINSIMNLHTDNCTYHDIPYGILTDDDVEEVELVSAEEYNRTINANNGEIEEEDTIIILLTEKKRDYLEEED